MANETPSKHIRARGEMRADRRFAVQSGRGPRSRTNVNHHGTICGAEPTADDIDRKTAAHFLRYEAVPVFATACAEICPACRAAFVPTDKEGK